MANQSTKKTKKSSTNNKTQAAKRSSRPTKAELEQIRVEQQKTRGVVVMLVGLILAIWFIVQFGINLTSEMIIGDKLQVIVSAVCNIIIGLAIVYRGFTMFVQRKPRLSGWQILGWLFFFFAISAIMHLGQFDAGIKTAFLNAVKGLGGGVCGFIPSFAVHFIPAAKVQYIVLIAFIVLGLMLGTDMKIFGAIAGLFRRPKDELKEQIKADKKAAKKEARAQAKAEKEQAAAAQNAADDADTATVKSIDLVKDSKDDNFLRPPIITDYSGRFYEENIDNEDLTIGDMLAWSEEDSADPDYVREMMPRVSPRPEDVLKKAAAAASEPVMVDDDDDIIAETRTVAVEPPMEEPAEEEIVPEPKPQPVVRRVPYKLPTPALLTGGVHVSNPNLAQQIQADSQALEKTLASFGVKTRVVEVICGPAIIRYELEPAPGVKVSRIVSLQDDIALALAAKGLRIEAPVPGKSVIGIEIAKPEVSAVYFKEVVSSDSFKNSKAKLPMALGIDISGNAVIGDLAQMPHLLIAGATGSGKSVCMNTLICSLLFKAKPDELKFIMIDPKKVELAGYNGLPHLARPVVTDPKKAAMALKEIVNEMDRRYTVFTSHGVKNFTTYNELPDVQKLPQIVILIDELADLMMVASRDVEDSIVRLTQLARAAGIHLVIATQRPSVNVITGLIKANVPSRIAFAVSSQVDSRTILDMGGAEKLLGKGDMLYYPTGLPKPIRVQGAFLSEEEIARLVEYCSKQAVQEFIEFPSAEAPAEVADGDEELYEDDLFVEACRIIVSSEQASASYLQRRFRIGYNRAARLVETMEEMGIVSPPDGKKRTVLVSMEQLEAMLAGESATSSASE